MIVVLFIAGCSSGGKETSTSAESQGNETSKVRLGIEAGVTTLPFRAAEEQGYFNKYNLEPSLATFAYGIDTINALFTEQTDTGIAADYALLNSLGKGDLVILGTISRFRRSRRGKGLLQVQLCYPHYETRHHGAGRGTQRGIEKLCPVLFAEDVGVLVHQRLL